MKWPTFSPICRNYCVWVSVCVYVCIVSCHARLEQCWSTGQADGIWPCPGVLWHIGMQDSKLSGQELVHMALRILMCQHCICNSSSGVPFLSSSASSSLPTNYSYHCQHHSHISVLSVGGVVCWVCKWALLGLPTFGSPCGTSSYQFGSIVSALCIFLKTINIEL